MTTTNGTPPDALPPRTVAFTIRIREAEARKLHDFARALNQSPTGFATALLQSAVQGIPIEPSKARAEQTTIDDLLLKKRGAAKPRKAKKTPKKRAPKRAPKKK